MCGRDSCCVRSVLYTIECCSKCFHAALSKRYSFLQTTAVKALQTVPFSLLFEQTGSAPGQYRTARELLRVTSCLYFGDHLRKGPCTDLTSAELLLFMTWHPSIVGTPRVEDNTAHHL